MSVQSLTTKSRTDPEDEGAGGVLDRDTVAKACKRFRSRIEAVLTANNHFIEYIV